MNPKETRLALSPDAIPPIPESANTMNPDLDAIREATEDRIEQIRIRFKVGYHTTTDIAFLLAHIAAQERAIQILSDAITGKDDGGRDG